MFNFSEGKLEKLKIIPCTKPDFSDPDESAAYEVLLNPEKFSEKYEVKFEESQPDGATAADLKFKKILPQTLDLSFIFDSSGVLVPSTSFGTNLFADTEIESVPDQLKRFKEVAFDYNGETHQPRYLILSWGESWGTEELFKGRMVNLNISYTLFSPGGVPTRATAEAKFKKSLDKEAQEALKKNSSPDLSHVRVVNEGDTLPLMTYKIYGDSKYFLEVARVNKITNFRKLEVGQEIFFPPIDKTGT